MKSISTSVFKEQCLQLIKEVVETGAPFLITQDGQPIAQLGPISAKRPTLIGAHRERMRITGDIVEPMVEQWEVEQ